MSYETRYAARKWVENAERANSPEAAAWRARDSAFREQAERERDERFPDITAENFREASDWFEARVSELHSTEPWSLDRKNLGVRHESSES